MSDTCQAITAFGVCRQPRAESREVTIGDVKCFVDLCAAHANLVRLSHDQEEAAW